MLKHTYLWKDDSSLKEKILLKTKLQLSTAALSPKIIDEIVNQEFVQENPDYYTFYPYLFKDAFIVDEENLDLLSIAGFLYYRSTIAMDNVFDDKNSTSSFEQYIISNICQEQTIAILSKIFGENLAFWQSWTNRKLEYIRAYQIDFNVKNEIKTFQDFFQLADLKSAIGKISLDALSILSKPKKGETVYHKLLDSHSCFYGAFQILDDIYDFEEDSISGQTNIARTILYEKYPKCSKYSINEQKKYIYSRGIADLLYERALDLIGKSFSIIQNYNVPRWKAEIQSLHNTIVIHRCNVFGFLFYSKKIQLNKSDKKTFKSLQDTIQCAKGYLERSFMNDNGWKDFLNGAGVSDVWASYFVNFFYCETFPEAKIGKDDQSCLSLEHESEREPLLGYNSHWIPDADTTSFYLLSKYISDGTIDHKVLGQWLTYQNLNGGFRTYKNKVQLYAALNDKSISNIDGWLNSHFCVSATAFYVMCRLNITTPQKSTLRKYLFDSITNGNYQSYWWCSPIYGLSFIILSCAIIDDITLFNRSVNLAKDEFRKNIYLKENLFFTGLMLHALSISPFKTKDTGDLCIILKEQLERSQNKNGSWGPSINLRIPKPSVLDITRVTDWSLGTIGTNVVFEDFNRLFSTVVSMAGLDSYFKNG